MAEPKGAQYPRVGNDQREERDIDKDAIKNDQQDSEGP